MSFTSGALMFTFSHNGTDLLGVADAKIAI